jgi:quinol monooxygenase YgiN
VLGGTARRASTSVSVGDSDLVIVRVLRARIRPGKVGAFNAVFRQQIPLLQAQPGLLYVKLARRLQGDGGEDVVLFEEWEDASSLYRWVGPNLMEPRLVEGARELIDELVVAHYEALDRHDPDATIEGATTGEPFQTSDANGDKGAAGPPGD